MNKVKNLAPTTVPVQVKGIDEDQEASIHSFPRDFAKEHGVKEAIVLGFLAHKVRRSNNLRDGKKWFYDSLENIAARYSYIPRSTLADILKRLEAKNIIEVNNYNKKSYDRTRWYTIPKQFLDAAAEVPIKFNSKIAESIGIAEAVLVYNLTYFVTLKITLTEPRPYHSMPPGEMAGRLPFSKSTIKKALKNLIKANLIIQHATKRSHYTLPPPLLLSGLESDGMGLDSDEIGRESDAMGLNPYDKGLKSDNYTHYKTFLKPFEGPLDKFQLQTEAPPPAPADLNTEKTKQCNGEIINGIGCADPMDARKNTNTLLKYSDVIKNDEKLPPELDDESPFVRAPYNLMCHFVETLSAEKILKLRDIADNDDLLNALNMAFEPFCLELCKGSESFRATYSLLHMTGLGMLVRSLRQLSGKEVGHPIQALNRKIYPLMLAMYQIVDAHQEAIFQLKCESELNKTQEEYSKSWETLPELIRKQLDYPNLAPADKMRLLKRIIHEFNEKGFLKGITIHRNVLNGTTKGYKLAEEFFKMNEERTVNEVVSILFNCADAHLEPTSEDGGYDKKWHARKGTDLHFLFRNIEQIINELNMGHKFFKIKYLPKETAASGLTI